MELNTSLVNKALQYAYDKAINGCEVNGIRLLDSAADLAMSYNNPNRTVRQNATSLINWQCSKSAASGFATAFGGFAVMAVGLPANLTSVLYVQLRMIAAIAILAGYDPHDDQVQTYAYICLTGSSAHEFVKNLGVKIGEAYANKTIQKKISGYVN